MKLYNFLKKQFDIEEAENPPIILSFPEVPTKEIRDKIESWDDPTAPTLHRDYLIAMHYYVEECIQGIEGI